MICGHPDVVIELMLGGKTRKIVLDWLQDTTVRSLSKNVRVDKLSSKL
jgi:hypothetical protein